MTRWKAVTWSFSGGHMCSGRMPPSPTPFLTWRSHQVLRKSSLSYKVKVSLSLFKLGMCFLSCSGHGRRYLLVYTRRYWFHMRPFVRTFVTCFLTRTCVNLCFRSVRPGDAVKNIPEFDFGRKLWGLTWLFRGFEDHFSAIYSLLDETLDETLSRFLVHRCFTPITIGDHVAISNNSLNRQTILS